MSPLSGFSALALLTDSRHMLRTATPAELPPVILRPVCRRRWSEPGEHNYPASQAGVRLWIVRRSSA